MRRRFLMLALPVVVAVIAILALTGAGKLLADTTATTSGHIPQEIAYTGRVVDGSGTPITGTRTVTFSIYDASSGGSLHWTETKTVTLDNVGYFATRLGSSTPIMPSVFDGSSRYLQLQLNGTTFPRQKFSSVPYAFQSYYASYALTSTYAYTAGYAVDAKYAMTATYALNSNGSESSEGYAYVKVVAKSGGDYETISEAMDAITPTSSARYLIKVMPGSYNERVVMKPYVHLHGAGVHSTYVISSVVGDSNLEESAVLVVPANAQVSHLSVRNTGDTENSVGIRVSTGNTYTTISYVHSSVTESGGQRHIPVYLNSGNPSLYHVNAEAAGGSVGAWALFNSASDSFIDSSSFKATGSAGVNAMRINGGDVVVQNTRLDADGDTALTTRGVEITGGGSPIVRFDHSTIHTSGTGAATTNGSDTVYIGASLLEGGVLEFAGSTIQCAQSYDEAYNDLVSDCGP